MILPYRAALGILRATAPLLSLGEGKVARGMAGRRGAHHLLEVWGGSLRDETRPVLWFHAPSAGEALVAQAVIEACVERRRGSQVVFTFFSPSAESIALDMGADVATYLPWDLAKPMGRVLDAVRPDAIVFTRTEVWPVLTAEAHRRGIPVAMAGATLAESSGRRRWPTRTLLRPAWASLTRVAAVSESDGARLIEAGVASSALSVTGDPGVDAAVSRLARVDDDAPWIRPFRADPRPNLIAGSTWPSDERVLLPALAGMADVVDAHGHRLRVVIAPHEPDRRAVDTLVRGFSEAGRTVCTLSQMESSSEAGRGRGLDEIDVVVIDRVGVLSGLYRVGALAFVGGGFGRSGLHSVVEPAAAGLPVLFGPACDRSTAAHELLSAGGAKLARDQAEVSRTITRWLQDEAERNRVGGLASGYIEGQRGAAARTADLINALLPHP